MGVPGGQNGLEWANFAQNWVSGRPDLGSETPDRGSGRPRSEIRGLEFGQNGQICGPQDRFPLWGTEFWSPKEAKTPLIWPKRPILGIPAWKR